MIALKQAFSILNSMGRRAVWASRKSVGVVLKPPVMAIAPALCVVVSFLMKFTEPFLFPFVLHPCRRVHHMLIPYMLRGSATLM